MATYEDFLNARAEVQQARNQGQEMAAKFNDEARLGAVAAGAAVKPDLRSFPNYDESTDSGSGRITEEQKPPKSSKQKSKKRDDVKRTERFHHGVLNQLSLRELIIFTAAVEGRPLPELPKADPVARAPKKYRRVPKLQLSEDSRGGPGGMVNGQMVNGQQPGNGDGGTATSFYVLPQLHQEMMYPAGPMMPTAPTGPMLPMQSAPMQQASLQQQQTSMPVPYNYYQSVYQQPPPQLHYTTPPSTSFQPQQQYPYWPPSTTSNYAYNG